MACIVVLFFASRGIDVSRWIIAYLTFVARPIPTLLKPPSTIVSRFFEVVLGMEASSAMTTIAPGKVQVPSILPKTLLENKRYLLTGRRRARRIHGRDQFLVSPAFKAQLLALSAAQDQAQRDEMDTRSGLASTLLEATEKELMTEAYMRNDPDLRVEDGHLIASIEGYMEPVKIPVAEIEAAVQDTGKGSFRRLDAEKIFKSPRVTTSKPEHSIEMEKTICMSLWIVRPQHCKSRSSSIHVPIFFRRRSLLGNSKSILFGGTLMRWIEEVAAIRFAPFSSIHRLKLLDSKTIREQFNEKLAVH
jgi:hypothetical protein